jgi:uncharacterized protein UU035
MNNTQFLECITQSFLKFLDTGSRSNEKLKILHGAIAKDLLERLKLKDNSYQIKSLGFSDNKEGKIKGRYIDKNVDITIYKDDEPIAGIGVKFVMQNYAQNSNNYFENMLGETANIRSNKIPYFQIFIIPEKLPYYKQGGIFDKWESFNEHHLKKYKVLSKDNEDNFLHTPNKMLLYVLFLPEVSTTIIKSEDYINFYKGIEKLDITISNTMYTDFGKNVIVNNYEEFINKVEHSILAI